MNLSALQEHFGWVAFAAAVILLVLGLTIFTFKRRGYVGRGAQKGEAANPARVRRQNPPDHA